MVDTCCDPTPIDYVIPANDDAAKSISYIMDILCQAINEGLNERKLEKEKETPEVADDKQVAGKKLRSRKGAKAEDAAEETAPVAESAVEEAAPAQEETPEVAEAPKADAE